MPRATIGATVTADTFHLAPDEDKAAFRAWLEEHGVDPNSTTRVEYVTGRVVRVEEAIRTPDGKLQTDPSGRELLKRWREVRVTRPAPPVRLPDEVT